MVVEDVTLDPASFDSTHADISLETGCVHRIVRKLDKVVYRRRLRFKRMPNLVQTEVPLVNSIACDRDAVMSDFQIDHSALVHKYLPPIVAGLVLAASCIEPCMERGERVNVLALGVGGGALPIFLQKHLGFHVQAVDIDSVVLDLAHRHFGLQNGIDLEVEEGDALQYISKLAAKVTEEMAGKKGDDHRVHVIVLDVDDGDARCGLSSPPSSFLERSFLSDARTVLHDGGVLAINVVPNGAKSYSGVITSLLSVFDDVYETAVEGDVNRVVFALPSKCTGVKLEGPLARLVTKFLDGRLITAIQKAHTE
jgi:hypothetical protein